MVDSPHWDEACPCARCGKRAPFISIEDMESDDDSRWRRHCWVCKELLCYDCALEASHCDKHPEKTDNHAHKWETWFFCGKDAEALFQCKCGVWWDGKPCSFSKCEAFPESLCDAPMGRGKTCDLPVCPEHSRHPLAGKDIDYCLHHAGKFQPLQPILPLGPQIIH